MLKTVSMAIAAAFIGVGLAGHAQATSKPIDPLLLAQTQVPPECAQISDPAERQKCLRENQDK